MIPVLFSVLEAIKDFFNSNGLSTESGILPGPVFNIEETLASISITDGAIASAPVLLLAAGIVIFLGVAGEAFFKRTGIPDVAFLMVLGVILGPILGIIQPDIITQIVPYFAAIALIIIMFDGGLNLDLKHMAKTAHFAVFLSIMGFIASVLVVTLFAHYGIGCN